jgi:endonuclease YncB( thermonuclease family)
MRLALLVHVLVILACGRTAAVPPWSCQLTRVVDGDTLHARCDGENVKVRLLRIDTPERGEPGYEAAAGALREILREGPLELEFEEPGLPVTDDYERLLAYVRVGGELANVEMVRRGWSSF